MIISSEGYFFYRKMLIQMLCDHFNKCYVIISVYVDELLIAINSNGSIEDIVNTLYTIISK